MPYKPKKPCKFPGCKNLTSGDYCSEHEKVQRDQYNSFERRPDINRKYGHEWRRVRARYIKEHPLCEECLKYGKYPYVEAIVGAVYYDSNYDTTRRWILKWLIPLLERYK